MASSISQWITLPSKKAKWSVGGGHIRGGGFLRDFKSHAIVDEDKGKTNNNNGNKRMKARQNERQKETEWLRRVSPQHNWHDDTKGVCCRCWAVVRFLLTLSMYTVRFMKCPMKCRMKCLKALEAQIPCFLLRKLKINNMFGKKKKLYQSFWVMATS